MKHRNYDRFSWQHLRVLCLLVRRRHDRWRVQALSAHARSNAEETGKVQWQNSAANPVSTVKGTAEGTSFTTDVIFANDFEWERSIMKKYIFLLNSVVALVGLGFASAYLGAATLTVTGTADTTAVDGEVTLREAITSINNGANANADVAAVGSYGSSDTIAFAIPGAGVHTIAVAALPGSTSQ